MYFIIFFRKNFYEKRNKSVTSGLIMLIKKAPKLIKKLLVANRGEIAIRILRAGYELGLRTVAVYTYEDRYSLHRYKADEAYQIGKEDEPLKPYLDIEEIIGLAKQIGADAIHPGYGFLSENPEFARRCREEGIIFVGPPSEVLEKIGNKVSAKLLAKELGIPTIESNEIPLKTVEDALEEARRIGFPVMLKAAGGGGGRGMRVAHSVEELTQYFKEARQEAEKAFQNPEIFIEKYIDDPKHIEVQILGDEYGNIVHLFERDCSVQRRFQKVIEIAPAPGISQYTKEKLYAYALTLMQAVNYSNAGTVEFLVDKDENIYFIEVNPRIQVEHTVTEEITGIDLVRSQILIAMGLRLNHPHIYILNQSSVSTNGYAIQCRITTEDPENNFRPDYGRIIAYRHAGGFGIRVDEGSAYPGATISPFFDSMLVKVTAWGRTLWGACDRMFRTLAEFRIRGVKTNIPFLQNVVRNETLRKGEATVKFIDKHPDLFQIPRRLDRGTRTLTYLGEVIVNGNPDVTRKESKQFRIPHVPDYDKFGEYPDGSKQLYEKLGREEFCEWLKVTREIQFTDTTFRDAHQSLIATRVRTLDMLRIAESFAKNFPKVFSMEVWGGATFDVALRFLKEDPWERLRKIRKAVPNILLQMLLRGSNAVGYKAYPDNLIEKFIIKSWENGVDIFRIFDSLNWLENMKTSINTVLKETNALAEVAICYTGDILDKNNTQYTLEYYLDLAKRIEDAGAHILAIKDMAGLLRPYAAEILINKLKETVNLPVHLHTHDTAGIQLGTYVKAIEAGVDVVDVAIASMSGLTSQPNFNSLVAAYPKDSPRYNPIDWKKLNEFANYWEVIREYYYPFESGLKASTAEVYEHEIPGGQYSNLLRQADALGLKDKWELIKKNYKAVNELFGNLIKVTPSSKVVGDMALFMTTRGLSVEDILKRGESLSFPQSVKSFFRGELGQPPGGFPEEIQKIVLKDEEPMTKRPNEYLDPIDFEKEWENFKQKFGDEYSFEDLLSYLLYPKVFEEYAEFREKYGDISYVPTPQFFFGMEEKEETLIEIDKGKTLIVKYLYTTQPNEEGVRTVYFELNGQTRSIEILDKSLAIKVKRNEKVGKPEHIGSPLQGRLSRILVKEGQIVEAGEPLFVIEAMKMETTVIAPYKGLVKQLVLPEKTMVEPDDLILVLEKITE